MKKLNLDLAVGLFLIAGFLAFAYISLQLGEFSIFARGNQYRVIAKFNDVSGLKEGATVEMSGVTIGSVQKIGLAPDDRAAVTMGIRKGVKITDDAMASIRTQGLIGDKYVRISQGGSDKYLKNGSEITETESAVDLEDLIGKYIFGKV
ncbi:MAG: outer membrane lipid asymmetry maintenance protein MlaD [Desulfobacteraceae bacterium]|nr:outer membrane lipid asymmetry maintenance protein MlaD [Desulfobacteraceae bacterium]